MSGDRSPGVAATVQDITPAWLSAALSSAGPFVEVAHVEARRIGTGQMGTAYRLTIRYADGSSGPARLVAKLAADDPAVRGQVGPGYRNEVGFYAHVAPTVSARVPRCWYHAISDDGSTFTLLLEDLSPAEPGVQVQGCTVEQAEEAVRNLAGLHAPRWEDASLFDLPFVNRTTEDTAAFLGALHVDATERFVARFRGALSADDDATLRAAAAITPTWLLARPSPFAVTHGDYRLDNLLFHPDGPVTAVDWQTASVGPPLRDVGYFLATSLDVALRREHEDRLVRTYHDELVALGVRDYAVDACREDYRVGVLQGPLITVLGSEFASAVRPPAADAMFLAMATRSCAAIRDLGSLDLLGREMEDR